MIEIDEKQFAKAVTMTLILIGLITAVIVSWKLYSGTMQKLAAQKSGSSVSKITPDTDQAIIDRVGRHIVLPGGVPKVVPVKDVETLRKGDPFFNSAQEGDELLVYSNKVILYSPTLDKVVEVATIKVTGGNK
jgi:hypothetical protein